MLHKVFRTEEGRGGKSNSQLSRRARLWKSGGPRKEKAKRRRRGEHQQTPQEGGLLHSTQSHWNEIGYWRQGKSSGAAAEGGRARRARISHKAKGFLSRSSKGELERGGIATPIEGMRNDAPGETTTGDGTAGAPEKVTTEKYYPYGGQ